MSSIPAINNARQSTADPNSSASLGGLTTDDFLKLMISQLQNQDPLNPTDNNQMLQQINEIRSIGATDKLTSTLDSVLMGQSLASSTSLIGMQITASSDDNQNVSGIVDHVSVAGGVPKLHIGENVVSLNNVINVTFPSQGG